MFAPAGRVLGVGESLFDPSLYPTCDGSNYRGRRQDVGGGLVASVVLRVRVKQMGRSISFNILGARAI